MSFKFRCCFGSEKFAVRTEISCLGFMPSYIPVGQGLINLT